MNYARTLADTGEWVWFPGAPRVQGITNLLWTVWMAVLHGVGLRDSSAALMVSVSGIVLLVCTAWIVTHVIRDTFPSKSWWIAASAGGLTLLYFPTTYWTLRGMEVGLLAFCTVFIIRKTLIYWHQESQRKIISLWIIMFVGLLTRFDFLIICVVILTYLIWTAPMKHRISTGLLHGSFIASVSIGICLFQKLYWGSWLPNTYHLKMEGVSSIDRIERGITAGIRATPLILLVAGATLYGLHKRVHTHLLALTSSVFFSMIGYATYIGGDAWEDKTLNRFYATVLPLVTIILIVVIRTNRSDKMRNIFFPLLGPAMLAVVMTSVFPVMTQVRQRDPLFTNTNHSVTEATLALRHLLHSDAVIATVWAGIPAYYLQRPMVDLLGKNDARIANDEPHGDFFPGHNKWDYDYSIGQLRPDVIFQTFTRGLEPNLNDRLTQWGYVLKCTPQGPFQNKGIYFKETSTKIEWSHLTDCPSL